MVEEVVDPASHIGRLALVTGPEQSARVRCRWASGVALLASMVLLSGCSPDNVTGVGLSMQRMPQLHNCGTWFRAVTVTDAETGREIWSAEKSSDANEYGVADVTVGVLPDADWVEGTAISVDPRPAVWRFAIPAPARNCANTSMSKMRRVSVLRR